MASVAHHGPADTTASPSPAAQAKVRIRLLAIDALRGLVMLFMLVDHVRETWYLQNQVADPMDALTTAPELFFTRLTSQICAPVFIALTGWGQDADRQRTKEVGIRHHLVKPVDPAQLQKLIAEC